MPDHSPPERSKANPHKGRPLEFAFCLLLAIAAGGLFFWTAVQPAHQWAFRDPNGYYPLQTAGFRSGHLYAQAVPNPELLALPNPYDPVANAPYRVHDMSLFKGHYYLYYGVTPVLIFFWPVVALSGWYPLEPVAVAFFCTGAVWMALCLILDVRRRLLPEASTTSAVTSCVCLAFATPLILLVEAPQFYQVAISCAVLMQLLMLAAVYFALVGQKHRGLWLAVGGLMYALSVGARPNYALGAVALLIPIQWDLRSKGLSGDERKRRRNHLAKFAFAPVVVIGGGLMLYNWMRFGSVFEFGEHYMLSGTDQSDYRPMSIDALFPNFWAYLLDPGVWRSYFPFFRSVTGKPYGLLLYAPWLYLAIAAFRIPGAGRVSESSPIREFSKATGLAALLNLVFLLFFGGVNARYCSDFSFAGFLLAGIGALSLSHYARTRKAARATSVLLGFAAALCLFFPLSDYVASFPVKDAFFSLARLMNTPGFLWQKARGEAFGGLRLELSLPANPQEMPSPVFETGSQLDRRDWLQIDYPSPGNARLSWFHAGAGLFEGSEFPIPADRRIEVKVQCSSLLPPYSDPYFKDWSRSEFDQVDRDLEVSVNGTEVLRAAMQCYEASPADLRIGRLEWSTSGMSPSFDGRILAVSRLPLERPEKQSGVFSGARPVKLTLYLPSLRQGSSDPLLVTGQGTNSDLVYCIYEPDNRIRFGLDHFGAGGPQSESVAFDPLAPHTVLIWMGSMAQGIGGDRFVLVFDGRTLLNVRPRFYPGSAASAIVGYNAFDASTAGTQFTGRLVKAEQVPLDSLPPEPSNSGAYGGVEMSVLFPQTAFGLGEPLVVTGVAGAGDLVYLHYVDIRHVVVGFDHWGVSGTTSDPIEVDYDKAHRITVSMDSLYPPDSKGPWKGRLRVTLDGVEALDAPRACYPSSAEDISIGKNKIGGSTCGSEFTGTILSVDRTARPPD